MKPQVQELLQMIEASPTCFHAVENICRKLQEAGCQPLNEGEPWSLTPGKRYFVTRNRSSVIAFALPEKHLGGYHIVASHSDSPTFKLKDVAELEGPGDYLRLNTERYGGMICSTWMDRPLSIAGRVLVQVDGAIQTRLVEFGQVVIPNLAIHFNRKINDGYTYDAHVDMVPLFAQGGGKDSFRAQLAQAAGVEPEQLLSSDLFLACKERGTVWGPQEEFLSSPRLDDLECAFSSVQAFLAAQHPQQGSVNLCCVFDNEEVGSGTKQGADSTFLEDVLHRIHAALGKDEDAYYQDVARSFMLSADNAHAVHPNHPGITDPVNCVRMNGGVVIKFNANQKYTTDGVSAAVFRQICQKAGVPCQSFANRSDLAGGSTLGNIANAHVSLNTVDIGLAQLAMHSSCETAGTDDVGYMVRAMQAFYETPIDIQQDGTVRLG